MFHAHFQAFTAPNVAFPPGCWKVMGVACVTNVVLVTLQRPDGNTPLHSKKFELNFADPNEKFLEKIQFAVKNDLEVTEFKKKD